MDHERSDVYLESPEASMARNDTPFIVANVVALRRRRVPLHPAHAGTMLALASLAELDSRCSWGTRHYNGRDVAAILGGAASTSDRRLRELADLGLVSRTHHGRTPVYRPLEYVPDVNAGRTFDAIAGR